MKGEMQVEPPENWMKIEVNTQFAFWLPNFMNEVEVQAIDSSVRRWQSKDMIVTFDYGRFSDPLSTYDDQRAYELFETQVSEQQAKIIHFKRDNGWWFTAIHFPFLKKDTFGPALKLTLVVETSPNMGKEISIRILNSITF